MPKTEDRRRVKGRHRIELISRWRTKKGKQACEEILTALKKNEPLSAELIAKISQAKSALPGVDLQCIDLSGENLDGVELAGARLQGANLARCSLKRANLEGADLRDVFLRNVDLSNANLEKTDFDGAILENTKLDGASMAGARFTRRTVVAGATKLSSDILIERPSGWAGGHQIKNRLRSKQ